MWWIAKYRYLIWSTNIKLIDSITKIKNIRYWKQTKYWQQVIYLFTKRVQVEFIKFLLQWPIWSYSSPIYMNSVIIGYCRGQISTAMRSNMQYWLDKNVQNVAVLTKLNVNIIRKKVMIFFHISLSLPSVLPSTWREYQYNNSCFNIRRKPGTNNNYCSSSLNYLCLLY